MTVFLMLAIPVAIIGLIIYFVFFGMAGRDWKEIKRQDEERRRKK